MRLDDTAIRDSLTSAEASPRAAAQAFEQAERQFQRLTDAARIGHGLDAGVEDAEVRRNNAQSDLEAAKARAVLARQQLQRTEVRAPFDGIVSDRKVSAGDTAQIGKELVKVIDPRSMRFEGLVSADRIGEVKAGQPVMFRVHGLRRAGVRRQGHARESRRQRHHAAGRGAGGFRGCRSSSRTRRPVCRRPHRDAAAPQASRFPATALVRDGDRPSPGACRRQRLQKVSPGVWASATRAAANSC